MWVGSKSVVLVLAVLVTGLFNGSLPAVAQTTTFHLQPSVTEAEVGEVVSVAVVVENVVNLGAFEFHLGFDSSILQPENVELGSLLASTGRTPVPLGPEFNANELRFAGASYGNVDGADGTGVVAVVSLRVVAAGVSLLSFNRVIVTDKDAEVLPADGVDGLITTSQVFRHAVYLPFVQ